MKKVIKINDFYSIELTDTGKKNLHLAIKAPDQTLGVAVNKQRLLNAVATIAMNTKKGKKPK